MMRSLFHNLSTLYKSLHKLFLDALFPVRCVGCGAYDEWICHTCHKTLPLVSEHVCPTCKTNFTQNGEVCFGCGRKKHFLDGVLVASFFHDPLLKKLIHLYKYRFIKDIREPLSLLLAQSLLHSSLPAPDMIIPVPLHKRRRNWRGFNQAEELARALDLRIPITTDILIRMRYTKPQAKTSNKKQRAENIKNAFHINSAENISNKNILLIDDVITTGATLNECAAVLKKGGAKNVHCLVLARE